VLMAVGTGLRRSELFALKWKDVDFVAKHLSVIRSIVSQVVGNCKTEASQNPCLFTNLWLRLCWNGVDILPSESEKIGSSPVRTPMANALTGRKRS